MSVTERDLFIREGLRPDLRAFFGVSLEETQSEVVLSREPGSLLVRFSSCKEDSSDGKEERTGKEIGKDDKFAIGSPSGPATDTGGGRDLLDVERSITESAHANIFA
jgi:hypothetical protein